MTRTVGVEEELLLVDAVTAEPRAVAGAVLAGEPQDVVVAELQQQQLETNTSPCSSLDELAAEIVRWRRHAAALAREEGARVAALATSPLPVAPELTPKGRYLRMARAFGLTAQEQLTCGCHVHVGVGSDEEGVAVLDRIRPWLAPLLALTANSPLWQGQDTGYAGYRHQIWGRWPTTGPQEVFGSAARYHATVDSLLATGTLLDIGMVYFDARLSAAHPTVEVRIADVCQDAEDAVLLAALVRGLVETAAREWADGRPPPEGSAAQLRLAAWRASRSGLGGALVHPLTHRPTAAREVIEALVAHVAPAVKDIGDLALVRAGVDRVLARGNGASRQLRTLASAGPAGVIHEAVARTVA
ncbi:glutamate--cysteine ligase [Streptomyces marincola]|uniref:Putative glutamate--cysteine ligase 2 n=1 Tax=Streptomyces marincola TaxID=2878388 RepID=A0A1W7CUF1_9ACTN|nr:glutamate--cysteine ligase [Streptomyces marincola]ARQ68020.1 carboxylate--amine ligase [Streptomyces marincola]